MEETASIVSLFVVGCPRAKRVGGYQRRSQAHTEDRRQKKVQNSIKMDSLALKTKEKSIKEALLLIQSLAEDVLDEVATALVEVSEDAKM